MKRKTVLYGIIAVVLAAIITVVLILAIPGKPEPPVLVRAFFHLYDDSTRNRLEAILEDFRGFYPEVELEYRIEPYVDMRGELESALVERDAMPEDSEHPGIVSVLASGDLGLVPQDADEPSNWIASSWGLYYDARRLDELGFGDSAVSALAESGFGTFANSFSAGLKDAETVFITGTAFKLPWLAWVQHLEVLERRGEMPDGGSPDEWSRGIDAFDSLVSEGLVNTDYRELNQAGSQLGIIEGKGLFVLSDDSIYKTVASAERDRLRSIPFPGSESQGWRIGSGVFLGAFTSPDIDSRAARAEELLLEYLHSEGVSERFLRETGIRILPRKISRLDIRDLPSLTGMAGQPEYQELLKTLND